ncbi:MAG TPA: ROK family protein [Streptomyces sp.]|nr:ROK family protein [Streptomyces sp.]
MTKADSQSNLARRTGLAQSTVSNVVRELHAGGLVSFGKDDPATGGLRRGAVSLHPTRGVAVGVHIDLDRTTVVARRVDQSIDRTQTEVVPRGANRGLREVMPALKAAVESAVAGTGLSLDDVLSAGVAVPGMVDPRTGEFAEPVIAPWQRGDSPSRDLAQWLNVPAALDNDANLGALAEQTYATSDDTETVVYLKASTDIGAGLVVANLTIRGRHGIAGEIGHVVMVPEGEVCACGGRGCLETVIGADALLRQVRNASRGRDLDTPDSLTALIERARAGDAICLRVLQEAGRMLGRAVAQLCNVLNPGLIVVGGQLAAAGDLVLGPCEESLRRHALAGALQDLTLRPGSLGRQAEAQGALALGLSSLRRLDDMQHAPW